jgi:hypothetical protein
VWSHFLGIHPILESFSRISYLISWQYRAAKLVSAALLMSAVLEKLIKSQLVILHAFYGT